MVTDRLVFVDESGAKTNMARLRGRVQGGARLLDAVPHGLWCTTTKVISIKLDGTRACMAADSATDRDVFREYVRVVLLPTLRPGDIVILDNLSAHDDGETRRLVESVSARLLPLPPYTPDLNPSKRCGTR